MDAWPASRSYPMQAHMIRLLLIAAISVVSIFVWLIVIGAVVKNNDWAAGAALVFGFLVTPLVLLRVWKGRDPGAKCPEGKGLYPECLFTVSVDDRTVSVKRPDGQLESLAVSELREVAIVTNDSGPWGADVWWHLAGAAAGTRCAFPGGATGEPKTIEFAHALPGFDAKAFIRAMGSTSNARFVCWTAPAP